MVDIVVVSHSQKLAEGVVDLATILAPETPMRAAGGKDDGSFGISFEKISNAINEIYTEEGVVILIDLGSAVMTTEKVLESMRGRNLKMVDCPVLEGAVAAAVISAEQAPLIDVIQVAEATRETAKF
ncbi:MAG: dihydroxyacetone kinase [Clostridiales bacterium]|nr:dihydroxyacetone kinase [Clostridiales bacterium]